MNNKIAIFTEFYPFGKGEEFLEDEIREAEKWFDEIALITYSKETSQITKYIPDNAKVITLRGNISKRRNRVNQLSGFFSKDVWKQIVICIKERGIKHILSGARSAVLEQSEISFLMKNEEHWANEYGIYYSYWLSGLASYLAKRSQYLNGKIVSRAHGYDCFYYRCFHPHREDQFKYIDAIYPISKAGEQDLIAQGCKPEIIHVSRLGVYREDERRNPHIVSVKKTIVTCSSIVQLKRLDLIIDALALIDDTYIEWIHFGDGILKKEVDTLAKNVLGDKSNISYNFTGWVSQEAIHSFYSANSVDLFINCSDKEGIPVSIMEAMSYGIPCIARDVGGNREIVNDNNGRLLRENCTIDDIKNAIKTILSLDGHDYKKMQDSAFDTYDRLFNAKKNYADFFKELIG